MSHAVSQYAAAVSEHPLATHAVGEAVGQVLDEVGPGPDVAIVFVTSGHVGSFEDIVAAVRATLEPGTLLGVTAESVLAGAIEIEARPAVTVWTGRTGPVEPVRLTTRPSESGVVVDGVDRLIESRGQTLVLLADPFSLPADALLARLGTDAPQLRIIGGLASAATSPGRNRLALDDQVVDSGAVGVLVRDDLLDTVVSQGCRPVGDPFVITEASGNLVVELGGVRAVDRLEEILRQLEPDDQQLAARGLHVGLVVDEHKAEYGRGDFLIRNLVGADRDRGVLAIGGPATVGTALQFHVRDASTASEDLVANLVRDGNEGSALVFTCNGRGSRLFGVADHDAEVVSRHVGGPVAGMFCAGEIGPIGGRNHLHGFTASVAIFGDPASTRGPRGPGDQPIG